MRVWKGIAVVAIGVGLTGCSDGVVSSLPGDVSDHSVTYQAGYVVGQDLATGKLPGSCAYNWTHYASASDVNHSEWLRGCLAGRAAN